MDLNQKIPTYLTDKRNITSLVIFTALFALVFINIYAPFEVNEIILKIGDSLNIGNQSLLLLISSSIITLTGVLVIVISRVILYFYTRRKGRVSLIQFSLWILVEVVCMASFYAVYEKIFLPDPRPFLHTFKVSIQNTALVLLLPYTIGWLYLSWTDKNKMLQKIKEGEIENPQHKEMIVFHDEKGTLRLSIKFSELLFLQAADNYVNIVYNNQGKQSKYLLRSSLKLIEDQHKDFPLVRCHRSYMVNFDHVKIIRREKDGLRIELDTPTDTIIPVSNTYMEEVFNAFGHSVE